MTLTRADKTLVDDFDMFVEYCIEHSNLEHSEAFRVQVSDIRARIESETIEIQILESEKQ